MQYVTHNTEDIDINGTHLQGAVKATYKELTSLFGSPMGGDGEKVDAQWAIKFPSGAVATIYNWKDGKNFCGAFGTATESITRWNVGGVSKDAHTQVTILLDLHREQASKPTSKMDQAFESANEIMETIILNKGRNYGRSVEVAMLVRKQSEIINLLVGMVAESTDMPKPIADLMMETSKEIGSRIIAKYVRQAIPDFNYKTDAADLMNWVDRLMDAEQQGAHELLKGSPE
jgi:hypothetical protein